MPKTSENSWAHRCFDATGQCRIEVDGERCQSRIQKRNLNNRFSHLQEKHPDITEKKSEELQRAESNQPTLEQLTRPDEWLIFFCRKGIPFRTLEDEQFRQLSGMTMSRKKVPDTLRVLSQKLVKQALRALGPEVTVALDIGTRHKRYLAFSVLSRGQALFYKLVEEESYTAAVVRTAVEQVVRQLAEDGVAVNGIVADNAANLQAIRHEVDDEPDALLAEFPTLLRCVCHVIQLAVRDCKETWADALKEAEDVLEADDVKIFANTTRWNSAYRVLVAANSNNTSVTIRSAAQLLEPLAHATDNLQRDDATPFDVVWWMQSLIDLYAERARPPATGNVVGATVAEQHGKVLEALHRRSAMLFSSTCYLALAYFSPTTNPDDDDPVQVFKFLYPELIKNWPHLYADLEAYEILMLAPAPNVTLQSYRQHCIVRLKNLPALSALLLSLLNIVPSEASVERMFSALKRTVSEGQVNFACETVSNTLRTASAYDLKAHRSEASPSPRKPNGSTSQEREHVEVSDTDEPDRIVTWYFSRILEVEASKTRTAGTQAPPPVGPDDVRRRTRAAHDQCAFPRCGMACKEHPVKPYVECNRCESRISVTHNKRIVASLSEEARQTYGLHKRYECDKCLNATSAR